MLRAVSRPRWRRFQRRCHVRQPALQTHRSPQQSVESRLGWGFERYSLQSLGQFLQRHLIVVGVALGASISLLCALLGPPFFADDFWQLARLKERPSLAQEVFGLFTFSDGNPAHVNQILSKGPAPWFTYPQLKISFWRPLSALLERLDYQAFGMNTMGAKVHSVLWYVAFIIVVGKLFSRFLRRDLALLALVIFGLAPVHREAVGWIASRNALITATFGTISLLFYTEWRLSARDRTRALSVLFLILALLGGEAGLGILAYFAAFECFQGTGGLRTRAFAIAPVVIVTCMWLALYYSMGYGTYGGGEYQNPLEEPVRFVGSLPVRMVAMLGIQMLGLSGELWFPDSRFRALMICGGIASVFLVFALLRTVWREQGPEVKLPLAWFGLGAIGSLIPQAAGQLSPRSLTIPSIGGSVVIAILLRECWPTGMFGHWSRFGTLRAGAVLLLATIHLVIAPVSWVYWTNLTRNISGSVDRVTDALGMDDPQVERQRLVFVQMPSPFFFLYVLDSRRIRNLRVPLSWWTLSFAQAPHRVVRTAPDRLKVDVIGGCMLDTPAENLLRGPDHRLRAGDRVQLDGLGAEVLADNGVGPTSVEFTFDRSIDDPSIRLMIWNPAVGFERIRPPSLGESFIVPSPL